MKFVSYLIRVAPWLTFFSILVGAIGGGASALLMAIISSRLDPEHTTAQWTSLQSFAVVMAVVLISGFISRFLTASMAEKVTFELRMTLSRQILSTPLRQLEKEGFGKILSTLIQDVSRLGFTLRQLPNFSINIAIIFGCLVYLGWLSLEVMGILVGFLVLAVVSAKVSESPAKKRLEKGRGELSKLVEHLNSLLEGIKELKLNRTRRRSFYQGSIEAAGQRHRKLYVSGLRIYAAANSWVQGLYFVLIAFLIYGLTALFDIPLAVLTGYTLTVLFMRGPLTQMIDAIPQFSQAAVSLDNVESLGLTMSTVRSDWQDEVNDLPLPKVETIELRGVTHSYFREREEREFTLGPIDLTLRPGELVYLVGGNGSGKTTLAKIITGLYPPADGELRLNGKLVTEENREEYQQLFSAIFGDFHLFDQLLEPPSGDLEATAHQLLEKLQLDHKVEISDGALSTTRLSQGQRKRLALLNAYLEDRPVYVFDEWAADQDPEFRDTFYRILLPELRGRGKVVLVISHDDRYYPLGDRLIKLESGQLLTAPVLQPMLEGEQA